MGSHSNTVIRAVLRCVDAPPGLDWKSLLLDSRVGGLPVLTRHLLALRNAGISQVTLVAAAAACEEIGSAAARCVPAGVMFSLQAVGVGPGPGVGPGSGPDVRSDPERGLGSVVAVRESGVGVTGSGTAWPGATTVDDDIPVFEQRADTVVDPRLLAQLVRLVKADPRNIVCLDVNGPNTPKSKSPYVVGVPETDEARPLVVPSMVAVGVEVHAGTARPTTPVSVGRYYWHRIAGREDLGVATSKVLLATMKATDGFFARTNRRVSLRISRLLLNTGVTANMVTIATLVCGLLAGWLMSRGSQAALVAGSVTAWFASMLDGVDGELARAKFQASPFGHWLEMACDYVFYVALFVGLGQGFHRVTGHVRWSVLGIGSGIGAIVSFLAVAHLKRSYARQGETGEFFLAYERTVTTPGHTLFMRVTPHLTTFFTRAVFPYFLVLFALLGWLKVGLVLMFISTQAFWVVAVVLSRRRMTLSPAPAPRLKPGSPTPVSGRTASL